MRLADWQLDDYRFRGHRSCDIIVKEFVAPTNSIPQSSLLKWWANQELSVIATIEIDEKKSWNEDEGAE